MATPRKWSNVAVAMQSALATALTVSAITKANPGVVSYTGTDPSNGDYVLMTVQGMHQINARVFRVANVNGAGNTFELEGENTTSYDTFSSGTAEVITFGTSITSILSVSKSGGDINFIPTTTIHTNKETQITGSTSAIAYNCDTIWDPADAGFVAMKAAYDAGAARCFKFTFGSGGPIMVYNGYVGVDGTPGGEAQGLATTQAALTMFGSPTFYSS